MNIIDKDNRELPVEYENKKIIEAFKNWCEGEYDMEYDDFGPNEAGELPIAFTTYSFSDAEEFSGVEHEVQVTFDLKHRCYFDYIDGELVNTEYRNDYSAKDIEDELDGCQFEDMIRECVRTGFDLWEKREDLKWREILERYIPDDYHSIDTSYVGLEGYCVIAEYDAEQCEVKTYYGTSWKNAFIQTGYYYGLIDMNVEDIEDMFDDEFSCLIKYEKHEQEKGRENDGCITI